MSTRNTLPIMTKYERSSLLARRVQQIAEGSPITIKEPGTTDPRQIAELELKKGTIPLEIIRIGADGTAEPPLRVTDMIIL